MVFLMPGIRQDPWLIYDFAFYTLNFVNFAKKTLLAGVSYKAMVGKR